MSEIWGTAEIRTDYDCEKTSLPGGKMGRGCIPDR